MRRAQRQAVLRWTGKRTQASAAASTLVRSTRVDAGARFGVRAARCGRRALGRPGREPGWLLQLQKSCCTGVRGKAAPPGFAAAPVEAQRARAPVPVDVPAPVGVDDEKCDLRKVEEQVDGGQPRVRLPALQLHVIQDAQDALLRDSTTAAAAAAGASRRDCMGTLAHTGAQHVWSRLARWHDKRHARTSTVTSRRWRSLCAASSTKRSPDWGAPQ